jgi:DNA-directed RNA polymerase subunit B"/DNA-directed RNA polymerase subunit B
VESNLLTNQLISALAIGTWVGGRTGISQRLERGSFVKTISHMRNVLSPLTSAQEHFEARELHPTHFGKLCVSETPEGATIGLRKYLALMAQVTYGASEEDLKTILRIVRGEKAG